MMGFVDAVGRIMPKGDGSVISAKLSKYIETRPDSYGDDGNFHASSLYYMCPRCEVLKRVIPKELLAEEKVDLGTRAKFDIGHALHWWYQNNYLGPMRVLKGIWKCLECGYREGTSRDPVLVPPRCDRCGASNFEYVECEFVFKEWSIGGKIDGILSVEREEYVLDMKTSDPGLFEKMTKPWPSNIFQVQIYMWLTGIKKGLLLYIDKSSNGPVPVKEFPVEYSAKTIDDVKGKVTSFRLAMESRTLPPCMCGKSRFGASCKEFESSAAVLKSIEDWSKG